MECSPSRRRLRLALTSLALMVFALGAWADEPPADEDRVIKKHVVRVGPDGDHDEDVRIIKKRVVHAFPGGEGEEGHHVFHWAGFGGGYLGVGLSDLTPELLTHFGVTADGGVLVNRVSDGSPAAAAGLRVGDIITRAGDTQIRGPMQLAGTVRKLEDGATLDIEYWRDGRLETTTATVEARDPADVKVFDLGDLGDLEHLEGMGPEIVERVHKSLEKVFDEDWQVKWDKQLQHLTEIDVQKLEERMEEMRQRLQELESRLEERGGN